MSEHDWKKQFPDPDPEPKQLEMFNYEGKGCAICWFFAGAICMAGVLYFVGINVK